MCASGSNSVKENRRMHTSIKQALHRSCASWHGIKYCRGTSDGVSVRGPYLWHALSPLKIHLRHRICLHRVQKCVDGLCVECKQFHLAIHIMLFIKTKHNTIAPEVVHYLVLFACKRICHVSISDGLPSSSRRRRRGGGRWEVGEWREKRSASAIDVDVDGTIL